MTRNEWGRCVEELSVATQQSFAKEQLEAYFNRLADLPGGAIAYAVCRYLETSQYKALPSIGTLRTLALEAVNGIRATPEQAWDIVKEAISRFGYPEPGKAKVFCGEHIWAVVRGVGGWSAICDTKADDRTTLFAQFRDGWRRYSEQQEKLLSIPEGQRPRVVGIPKHAAADLAKSLSVNRDRDPVPQVSEKSVKKLLPPK